MLILREEATFSISAAKSAQSCWLFNMGMLLVDVAGMNSFAGVPPFGFRT